MKKAKKYINNLITELNVTFEQIFGWLVWFILAPFSSNSLARIIRHSLQRRWERFTRWKPFRLCIHVMLQGETRSRSVNSTEWALSSHPPTQLHHKSVM